MTEKGMILEIQRMSTEDGPGLRTTVFLKGCGLDCAWCHNPESLSAKRELVWHDWRCIGCRSCLDICPDDALSLGSDGMTIDRDRCQECFSCEGHCPSLALEVQGRHMSVSELMDELRRDRTYYDVSGGGVTVSGGEPAMQPEFVGRVLDHCREEGISTALDTCGQCGTKTLLDLASKADIVLFDLKELDSDRHRRHTGKGNEKILRNLGALVEMIKGSQEAPLLWIRTPLIPEATADNENITSIGKHIAEDLSGAVARWELCAFNNLCGEKYRRLGRIWSYEDLPLMTEAELRELAEIALESGVPEDIVVATGMTRSGSSANRREEPENERGASAGRGGVS